MFENVGPIGEERPKAGKVLKTESVPGSRLRNKRIGQQLEGVMRKFRLVLFAMLFALPLAMVAKAQVRWVLALVLRWLLILMHTT